ncbi:Eco57I restriction-modification methylase domain-containing protein [Hymenobacter actinosclerus]|uniref:site-specific DNA-methyltransferase (adenine-specific) n=1 Tax=Hymenobacter actinosclerus TaxID=82805 RepID=A0A1I0A3S4_9BACT|nr:Eco57I restriction-modification methylase domain-containing protein [Hymenobacter actinosclerus]SES88734.1 TaqI-like C-terminal specificity domain-containing protein [Hymenobacter actinosclerus]
MEAVVEPYLGAVYTRAWVVELMLDLAGYAAPRNLVDARAVEPSVGQGAFLLPMVARLLTSCRVQRRPWLDCRDSLRAYDVDATALKQCRRHVQQLLIEAGVCGPDAEALLNAWLVETDYLLLVGRTTGHTSQLPGLFDEPVAAGVDFVLGNPPYVRVESIPEAQNARYRHLFPTMRGRADLYVGFFEAALRQLRPNGVCAFICADRWMLNQYGESLRRYITTDFAVELLLEMHDAAAFEDTVSAYPAISLIRRASQGAAVVARATNELEQTPAAEIVACLNAIRLEATPPGVLGLTAARVPEWFPAGRPWTRTTPTRTALLAYLEQHFEPLVSAATGTRVGIGIATGADAVFFTTTPDLVEPAQQLRLARPADVRTGQLVWGGQWLLSPWHRGKLIDLAHYPRLHAHLAAHRPQLAGRHVAKKNPQAWCRTIDKVDEPLYRRPKLYIPDIKNTLFPVLDQGETYPDHNLYFITSDHWDLEVLGGLLLSDLGTFFVECYGVRMRGGYLRMQAQYLRKIRVPAPAAILPPQADALRQAFRTRDVAAATVAAVAVYGIGHLWPTA